MMGEVIDGFIRGFKKTKRLRLERQPDHAARALMDFYQPCCDSQDMLGVTRDDVRTGDARLETERRALNRRRAAFGATSPRISATLMVYCVRSSVRQSGS